MSSFSSNSHGLWSSVNLLMLVLEKVERYTDRETFISIIKGEGRKKHEVECLRLDLPN